MRNSVVTHYAASEGVSLNNTGFQTLISVYNGQCAMHSTMTLWLQCNAWPLASICGSCFCVFPLQAKLNALQSRRRCSLWSYFSGTSAPALQCVIQPVVCFSLERMKHKDTQSSVVQGMRPRFNGNTLQKVSSLQTRHSVLQSCPRGHQSFDLIKSNMQQWVKGAGGGL